jgi:PKD repeat protein
MSKIVKWFWDFGDGTTSTEQHPNHTYPFPGTYTVKITVENSVGLKAMRTHKVTVTGDGLPKGGWPDPQKWN